VASKSRRIGHQEAKSQNRDPEYCSSHAARSLKLLCQASLLLAEALVSNISSVLEYNVLMQSFSSVENHSVNVASLSLMLRRYYAEVKIRELNVNFNAH
jgi:hypothetical protein